MQEPKLNKPTTLDLIKSTFNEFNYEWTDKTPQSFVDRLGNLLKFHQIDHHVFVNFHQDNTRPKNHKGCYFYPPARLTTFINIEQDNLIVEADGMSQEPNLKFQYLVCGIALDTVKITPQSFSKNKKRTIARVLSLVKTAKEGNK